MIYIHNKPKKLRIDISGCKNKDKIRDIIEKLAMHTDKNPSKTKREVSRGHSDNKQRPLLP